MGNPLPRTQSLTRQKWNSTAQKWDAALSKANRSGAIFRKPSMGNEKLKTLISGEILNDSPSRAFLFNGEVPLVRPQVPASPKNAAAVFSTSAVRHSPSSSYGSRSVMDEGSTDGEAGMCGRSESRSRQENFQEQAMENTDVLAPSHEAAEPVKDLRSLSPSLQEYPNVDAASVTSIQTETEGSNSRLLSRRGESSSFRGRKISPSVSTSSSFKRETVSTSFESEFGSRRKERRSSRSFQDGELSSIASESVRGSPPSIVYNQAPFSTKSIASCENLHWPSTPSSPDNCSGRSSVPFQWEEAPGKAKTIAAAAEMALARKLVRDESIRRLNAGSPRSSVDGRGSSRIIKQGSPYSSSHLFSDLPLPPSKKGSLDFSLPRKDPHSSHLIAELKAAVARKESEERALMVRNGEADDDSKSEISDFGEQAHIDLVAPAAAKIFNREDDYPVLTPIKTAAAVPFEWEEAPGKPKGCGTSPHRPEPTNLPLPPRLLGSCHNPSKEQQAKILESYSGNLMDMPWTSGSPTPLPRSRENTPTRRDRTPGRRDRTPGKRDITPGRREITSGRRDITPGRRDLTPGRRDVPSGRLDITPNSRDSTPTRRSYFPTKVIPSSGPLSFPSVQSLENVREHQSGPLRSNTLPNNFNAIARRVSQEFSRGQRESSFETRTAEFEGCSRPLSNSGSSLQDPIRSSRILHQELQIARCESSPDVVGKSFVLDHSDCSSETGKQPPNNNALALVSNLIATDRSDFSGEIGNQSAHNSLALVKVVTASAINPLSPTSILCGPDTASQRTISNLSTLSSAYAESAHSHRPHESISSHSQSDSCTSLESFVEEAYNVPHPWGRSMAMESSLYRDLGPIDSHAEAVQGNKSLEDSLKAIVKFCRKAKKWNKAKPVVERKSTVEPDMWAPTLATYFQKLELGGTFLNKVGSQVYPESRDVKLIHMPAAHFNLPCSPLKFASRLGEISTTPDRIGPRKPIGTSNLMKTQMNITACRSPTYRVMATDECFSVFSLGKVWSGTKARQARWGRRIRSSRLMGAILGALKRSLKCGKQTLPTIPSDKNLADRGVDLLSKDSHSALYHHEAVLSLSANHQLHGPH